MLSSGILNLGIRDLLKTINDPNYQHKYIKVVNNEQCKYINLKYLEQVSTVFRDMISDTNNAVNIHIDNSELFTYFCKVLEYDLSIEDEIYLTKNRKLLYLLLSKLDYYGMITFFKQILKIIIVPIGKASSDYIFSGPPSTWMYKYTNMANDIINYSDLFTEGVISFIIHKFNFDIDDHWMIFGISKSLSNKQYRRLLSFLRKNNGDKELIKSYENIRNKN